MRILKLTIGLLAVSLSLTMMGCNSSPEKHEGDIKFLLLWPSEDGTYRPQEVTLTTLNSPYEMKGSAAEVYYENAIGDSGFQGSIARPHLTRAGDVYVPRDAESAQAVAAYAHLEKIYLYEKELGLETQVSWPRRIGVAIRLTATGNISTHNNAHYFSRFDSIAVLPFSPMNGVPIGMNLGIIAHEHFHAHYQRLVMQPMTEALGDVEKVEDLQLRTNFERNNIVLRGWNEGLADFFASTFLRQDDFFFASLPSESPKRTLDGPVLKMATADQYKSVLAAHIGPSLGLLNFAYQQGTFLARMLREVSERSGMDRDLFLRQVMLNLSKLPSLIQDRYRREVLSFEEIVPVALEGLKVDKGICDVLSQSLSDEFKNRSFASCSAP